MDYFSFGMQFQAGKSPVPNATFERLERRRAEMFLVAGGFLLLTTVINGINLFTTWSLSGPITFLPVFLGPIVASIGIFGIIPELAHHHRRIAVASLLMLIFPLVATVAGLVLFLAAAPRAFLLQIFMVIYGGFGVGFTVFGAICYYTDIPSRAIGGGLFLFAIPWYGFFALQGVTTPAIDFVAFGTMSTGLLLTGYILHRGSGP